jgi:hypothetical protein
MKAAELPMDPADQNDPQDLLALIDRRLAENLRRSCPCWHMGAFLTTEVNVAKRFSGHICPDTARASCGNWIADNLNPNFAGGPVTIAMSTGRFTAAKSMAEWPVPLYGETKSVFAVIRQLVEEDPLIMGDKLARVLQGRSEWCELLKRLKAQARNAGAANPEGPGNVDLEKFRDSARQWTGVPGVLVALGRAGLPQTLSTARYAISQLDGVERGLPSRGLFVTSFAICGSTFERGVVAGDDHDIVLDGEQLVHSYSYDASWVTDNLLREARDILQQHEAWWQSISGVRLPEFTLSGRAYDPEHEKRRADIKLYIAGKITHAKVLLNERLRHSRTHTDDLSKVDRRRVDTQTRAAISYFKNKIDM